MYPKAARQKNRDGNTPLHILCREKSLNTGLIVLILAKYPQAAHIKNDNKQTPMDLLLSSVHSNSECVQDILEKWPALDKHKQSKSPAQLFFSGKEQQEEQNNTSLQIDSKNN